MKKLQIGLMLILGLGLTAAAAIAVEPPVAPAVAAESVASDAGAVPQAQIDVVKKREEMNKRRAELLKVRQQLIDSDNPGNVDGQQPIQ